MYDVDDVAAECRHHEALVLGCGDVTMTPIGAVATQLNRCAFRLGYDVTRGHKHRRAATVATWRRHT